MDAIIEIVFEIVFEVFGEFLFVLIGKIFEKAGMDKRYLRKTKIIIYSILALVLLSLLILSLINKKGAIIALILSYLALIVVGYYLLFIFKTVTINPKASNIIRWIIRILRYPFVISLIVLSCIYLNDSSKILMITGSAISIIIFVFIDAFRIYRYNNKIKIEEDIKD